MLPEVDFESLVAKYRYQILGLLIGGILIGSGIFLFKSGNLGSSGGIEVLESTTEGQEAEFEVVVEVAGSVEKPGVYKLPSGSRVEDALVAAGGVSADADRNWMEKTLNRASKLTDGQKVYIPSVSEQSEVLSASNFGGSQNRSTGFSDNGGELVNINTASQSQLESLWGIGPVYAQNIIEQRPYSSVEELLTRSVIKKNVYERNKDLLTVY